jgi:hypothetical protein
MLETDRPRVLKEILYVCRPAGTVSMPGVYGGPLDKLPFGALMNKGLPRPPKEMRGAARKDFETPRDMRTQEALRPFTSPRSGRGTQGRSRRIADNAPPIN